jgi:hypothetical protein
MKLIHRLGFRPSPAQRQQLEMLGVKLPAGIVLPGNSEPLVAFDLAEDHVAWTAVRPLIQAWGMSDVLRTEFNNQEIESAAWLEPRVDAYRGYPQPREEIMGYLEVTYDLSDFCRSCGIGKRQKAPFVMKGEPEWGGRSVMQLNWVFDEYFVTPQAWESAFRPEGVKQREVLGPDNHPLRTVVQLVIDEEVELDLGSIEASQCPVCSRRKHLPVTRGALPALAASPSGPVCKSTAWFGDGAQAHHAVLMRADVSRGLTKGFGKGVSFRPVANR